jgi:hypothetical protein
MREYIVSSFDAEVFRKSEIEIHGYHPLTKLEAMEVAIWHDWRYVHEMVNGRIVRRIWENTTGWVREPNRYERMQHE